MKCNDKEKEMIEILRSFAFLINYGYKENTFKFFMRSNPSVFFVNRKLHQTVKIIGSDYGSLTPDYSIIIERKKLFSYKVFSIDNYFEYFNCSLIKERNYSLQAYAQFIKEWLMPVIKGEMWIDELVSKRKK